MNTLKEIADLARSINNHTAIITAEDEREYNNNIKAAAVAVYNENMFSEKGDQYAVILSKSKYKLTRGLYDPRNGNPPFWVYGYYTHVAGYEMFPERHIIHTDDGLMDVDPATVGECVAKDKNGHNVYEGDVLKQDDANGVYVVIYNDKYFRFDVRHTYGFTMELSRLLREYKNETTNLDAEIVGNIYQNPELGEIRKREY